VRRNPHPIFLGIFYLDVKRLNSDKYKLTKIKIYDIILIEKIKERK
jgi:hypothetical protein